MLLEEYRCINPLQIRTIVGRLQEARDFYLILEEGK